MSIHVEVKPEGEKLFGLYVNGTLIGTSKLHCDATLAGEVIKKAAAPSWSEQREKERGWAAMDREAERASWGTGEMGQ